MMQRFSSASRALVVAGSVLLAAGCGPLIETRSTPVSFYVLNAPGEATNADAGRSIPVASAGPIVAVAPVRLPQYLDQRSIVTRSTENELDVAENSQWAGGLSDEIVSTLAEDLVLQIPSQRVLVMPVSPVIPVDYEVRVDIVRFERQPDGSVLLAARWTTLSGSGRQLIRIGRGSYVAPDVADNYAGIATAMSSLLAQLSRDIAVDMRGAPSPSS